MASSVIEGRMTAYPSNKPPLIEVGSGGRWDPPENLNQLIMQAAAPWMSSLDTAPIELGMVRITVEIVEEGEHGEEEEQGQPDPRRG